MSATEPSASGTHTIPRLPPGSRLVTGNGFFKIPQQVKPQCYIAPGHHNMDIRFKIGKTPDGLNFMLEPEDSPSKLLITKVPTLIIGMDVCHDRDPRDYETPSIAVVVHSREWPQISQYRAYVQSQPPKAEFIDSLYNPVPECDGKMSDSGIMRELLLDFCTSSGNRKPEQIIIFRYGVRELQVNQVLDAELDQIIKACECFDEKWSPKLAVIKLFSHEAPDNVPSRTLINHKMTDDFRDLCRYEALMIDTDMPRKYRVGLDQVGVGLSPNVLQDLVDSLSYVHQLRSAAAYSVAPFWFGLKSAYSEERKFKRMKTSFEPDDVHLERKRPFIDDGEELAVFALGHLNNGTGGKYKFKRYLYHDMGCFGYDYSNINLWQHVSMLAREVNGDNQKIVFAELCYSDKKGEYESIVHSVLDPNDHAGISYGCGFCFPSYSGPHISPHPADRSKFVAGRGGYSMFAPHCYGLLPRPK